MECIRCGRPYEEIKDNEDNGCFINEDKGIWVCSSDCWCEHYIVESCNKHGLSLKERVEFNEFVKTYEDPPME